MAVVGASPLLSQSLPSSCSSSTSQSQRPSRSRGRVTAAALSRTTRNPPPLKVGCAKKTLFAARRGRLPCLPTKEEVGAAVGGAEEEERYLARDSGWGVRRMGRVGEEMRRVALVQAEAFHVPVALFNDVFFDFFKAEVLAALIYKLRNLPPDRFPTARPRPPRQASKSNLGQDEEAEKLRWKRGKLTCIAAVDGGGVYSLVTGLAAQQQRWPAI